MKIINKKKVIVTTSWDDGAVQDLRLLKLLNKYNLKGTFYIPKNINFEIKKGQFLKQLSEKDILEIAKTQEIGAHGITHTYLDELNKEQIYNEVKNSKDWLEKLLNKEIKMFAYPGGKYNDDIVNIVKESSFLGARTTRLFYTDIKNPFLMGNTCQCRSVFSLYKDWSLPFKSKVILRRSKSFLRDVLINNLPISALWDWVRANKILLEKVEKNGGIWHIFGHSWEIERYKLWKDLEKLFKYISNRKDVRYLTNGEVIEDL
jgi:peptidoglycan/xylan/chitin deacetylase (PgdA/CDA1 family)